MIWSAMTVAQAVRCCLGDDVRDSESARGDQIIGGCMLHSSSLMHSYLLLSILSYVLKVVLVRVVVRLQVNDVGEFTL